MLLIGVNYHFMMNRFPDAGGAFAFTKNVLGLIKELSVPGQPYQRIYLHCCGANLTALALLGRRLMGDTLRLVSITVWPATMFTWEKSWQWWRPLSSARADRDAGRQIRRAGSDSAGAGLFVGVAVGGFLVLKTAAGEVSHYYPLYAPGKTPFMGMAIVMLAPWAYVGFESVFHSAEEFTFSRKRSFGILAVAVVTAAVTYITLSLMAVSVLPEAGM